MQQEKEMNGILKYLIKCDLPLTDLKHCGKLYVRVILDQITPPVFPFLIARLLLLGRRPC